MEQNLVSERSLRGRLVFWSPLAAIRRAMVSGAPFIGGSAYANRIVATIRKTAMEAKQPDIERRSGSTEASFPVVIRLRVPGTILPATLSCQRRFDT